MFERGAAPPFEVNDAHGHVAGDKVLSQVAQAIKARLRQQDIFCRTGGEEFAVLLPEVTIYGARITAEKIRAIAAATPVDLGGTNLTCTVSLGVACTSGDVCTLRTAMRIDLRLWQR